MTTFTGAAIGAHGHAEADPDARDAWQHLFSAVRSRLARRVRGAAADDLAANAVAEAWLRLGAKACQQVHWGWAFAVARNLVVMRARADRRARTMPDPFWTSVASRGDQSLSSATAAENRWGGATSRCIAKLLPYLTCRQRRIVELLREGRCPREVAAIVGIGDRAVRRLLAVVRARAAALVSARILVPPRTEGRWDLRSPTSEWLLARVRRS